MPSRERAERTERLLAASRLTPFQTRLAQDLSGGMKQKLALVCTLIHTPQLLLLDEPTTGVIPYRGATSGRSCMGWSARA